tara:strand:- start:127 stop:513 length:387 start_codon:yes stop_codon:yes gene_type:complete
MAGLDQQHLLPDSSFDSRLSPSAWPSFIRSESMEVVPEWSYCGGTDANYETGAAADPEPKHLPLSRLLLLAMRLLLALTKTPRLHVHQSTTTQRNLRSTASWWLRMLNAMLVPAQGSPARSSPLLPGL